MGVFKISKIKEKVLISYYQTFFEHSHRLVPRRFWQVNPQSKTGVEFRLYVRIIRLYIYMVNSTLSRGPSFVRSFQAKRFQALLHSAKKAPWWHMYFTHHNISPRSIRSIEDLKLIPPINYSDIVDVPKENFVTFKSSSNSIHWVRSLNTVNDKPFVWGLSKEVLLLNITSAYIKDWIDHGFDFKKYSSEDFYVDFNYPENSFRCYFFAKSFNLSTNDPEEKNKIRIMTKSMENLKYCILHIAPNEIPFLLKKLEKADLHPPVRIFFISSGKKFEKNTRMLAQEYFDCQFSVTYEVRELGVIGTECQENENLYHILYERFILEILDEKGNQMPPETEGIVTLTCLDNFLMPLIRYQPGDTGVLHAHIHCKCKNNLGTLLEIKKPR